MTRTASPARSPGPPASAPGALDPAGATGALDVLVTRGALSPSAPGGVA